jgi:hypothetical protein
MSFSPQRTQRAQRKIDDFRLKIEELKAASCDGSKINIESHEILIVFLCALCVLCGEKLRWFPGGDVAQQPPYSLPELFRGRDQAEHQITIRGKVVEMPRMDKN